MPTSTPSAPSISAAARPRPSATPPAATTGGADEPGATAARTASTTAGVITIPPTEPTSPPPASCPCATTTETPARAAAAPSSAVVTMCTSGMPAARARFAASSGGPHAVDSTGTRASMQASSCAAVQKGMSRFRPNGRAVSFRSAAMRSRISSGER